MNAIKGFTLRHLRMVRPASLTIQAKLRGSSTLQPWVHVPLMVLEGGSQYGFGQILYTAQRYPVAIGVVRRHVNVPVHGGGSAK